MMMKICMEKRKKKDEKYINKMKKSLFIKENQFL